MRKRSKAALNFFCPVALANAAIVEFTTPQKCVASVTECRLDADTSSSWPGRLTRRFARVVSEFCLTGPVSDACLLINSAVLTAAAAAAELDNGGYVIHQLTTALACITACTSCRISQHGQSSGTGQISTTHISETTPSILRKLKT